jgi:hypothetical protein
MVVHSEVGMDSEGSGHRMFGDTTVEIFAYIYLFLYLTNLSISQMMSNERRLTNAYLEIARKKEGILVQSEILSQHLPSFPPFFPLPSFLPPLLPWFFPPYLFIFFAITFSFSHFPFRTIFGMPYSFLLFIN